MEKKKQKLSPFEQAAQEVNPDRFKTRGEVVFDEMTYRGVDWLLNSAMGVAFTFWAARTKTGREWFSQPVEKFFERNLKGYIKDEQKLQEAAGWGSTFTGITVGGFTTIPPIMYLEKHKLDIVKGLDERIYGKEVVANDPRFAIAYKDIAEEPDQEFVGGMITRFVSLAPLLAITVSQPEPLKKYLYNPIGNLTKKAFEGVGIKGTKMKATMQADEGGKMVSDWDFMHEKIGFDFGLTIFYSYLHEYTYKLYSEMFGKQKDVPMAHDMPGAQIAAQQLAQGIDPKDLPAPEMKPSLDGSGELITDTQKQMILDNPKIKVVTQGAKYLEPIVDMKGIEQQHG